MRCIVSRFLLNAIVVINLLMSNLLLFKFFSVVVADESDKTLEIWDFRDPEITGILDIRLVYNLYGSNYWCELR